MATESRSTDDAWDGIEEMLAEIEQHQEAVRNTWGYELYEEIVEFPPDILDALRNNLPPSQAVLEQAKAFREQPEPHAELIHARCAELDKQIASLEEARQALLTEAKPHRTKLRGYDAILAPIRRLPFDIIRAIANYTLPVHPRPSTRHSPLNISQVSSAWRSAAHSLPQLWDTLHLTISNLNNWHQSYERIDGVFEHASDRSLNLFLYIDIEEQEDTLPLGRFFDEIKPFMPRMKRLGIGANDFMLLWPILPVGGDAWDLQRLESLHLLNYKAPYPDEEAPGQLDPSRKIFHNAPRLNHISSSHYFLPLFITPTTAINWSLLTNIRFDEDISIAVWTALVQRCGRMEVGEFKICPDLEDSLHAQSIVEQKVLRMLTIQVFTGIFSPIEVLSCFRFPGLRKLSLFTQDLDFPDDSHLPQSPSAFVLFEHLRFLSVDDSWRENTNYMIHVLRVASNLEELVFSVFPASWYPVLEAISLQAGSGTMQPSTSSPILPKLRIIRLQIRSRYPGDAEGHNAVPAVLNALVQTVLSRRPSQVPSSCAALMEVFVSFEVTGGRGQRMEEWTCQFVDALFEGLVNCRAEGMVVKHLEPWSSKSPLHAFDTWMPDS